MCILFHVHRPLACVSDRSRHSSASDEHIAQMQKTESLSSQQRAQKLRFVSSVEFRHSSGKPIFDSIYSLDVLVVHINMYLV